MERDSLATRTGFEGTIEQYVDLMIDQVRRQVGDRQVLCALSGGVDSSVCAAIVHAAVGDQLTCIFVDHGLMRAGEPEMVRELFGNHFGMHLVMVDAGRGRVGPGRAALSSCRGVVVLAGATVRLFPDSWRLGAPSKFTHLTLSRQAFEPIRIQRLGQARHYLGPLHGPELLVVLPEAKAIGSVAMSLLGGDDAPGVMLFSSRDAQHYQQGQGTQLLQEIALMLPGLLERWVERA